MKLLKLTHWMQNKKMQFIMQILLNFEKKEIGQISLIWEKPLFDFTINVVVKQLRWLGVSIDVGNNASSLFTGSVCVYVKERTSISLH